MRCVPALPSRVHDVPCPCVGPLTAKRARVVCPQLAAFSTRFTRWYALIFALQCGVAAWSVAGTLAATTAEEVVLSGKFNYALRALSLLLAQVPGHGAIMFDACGVTVARGAPPYPTTSYSSSSSASSTSI